MPTRKKDVNEVPDSALQDSDPRWIEIGGTKHPMLFNSNAAFKLDMYLRRNQLGTLSEFLVAVMSGQGSMLEVQLMFWALLEGGRKKTGDRIEPWTLDDVGDLIDDAGGIARVSHEIVTATASAMPQKKGRAATKKKARRNGTGQRSSRKR